MSENKKIIDSFLIRDTLNPKIWTNPSNPKDARLKENIKNALMRIAEKFIDYLGEEVFVDDIILTGSLSNYNWSEYSDFDLHVVIDYEQYGKQAELYKELFDSKKAIFNDKHDIKIFGYDVELYAQDIEEQHVASGVYSLMEDDWTVVPKKIKFEIDTNLLKEKIKTWTTKIDELTKSAKSEDSLKKLKDKLKEYRKCGLNKKGEFSYENLVFKYLRRSGHIEKLMNKINSVMDKELSIETQNKD